MTPIQKCIVEKKSNLNPIWLMRQAGRYLPEFREIRSKNQDFIKLCLSENLASEITLQPIERFNFDAAIIFSDILMLPYGLGQKVAFEKNFGPKLGELDVNEITKIDEIDFVEKVHRVYKAIKKVSSNSDLNHKNTIGFVGAPWTLLVYMINKKSPKLKLIDSFYNDTNLLNEILIVIEKFLINQRLRHFGLNSDNVVFQKNDIFYISFDNEGIYELEFKNFR